MIQRNWIKVPDKQHISRQCHEEVAAIVEPLAEMFEFISFSYNRVYTNGSLLMLNSHEQWIDYYWEHGCHFVVDGLPFIAFKEIIVDPFIAPESPFYQKVVLPAAQHFGFKHCVIFVNTYLTYVELFNFTFSENSTKYLMMTESYKPLIKKFILYFLDKAQPLINKHMDSLIAWGVAPGTKVKYSMDKSLANSSKLNKILITLRPTRYYLGGDSQNNYLTQRELECLTLICQNKTAKEIGKSLKISPRSAEKYNKILREKFNCETKKQLILKGLIYIEKDELNNESIVATINYKIQSDPIFQKKLEEMMGCKISEAEFFKS